MATTRNIQMQYFNGTDYDTLYPNTLINNVEGLSNYTSQISNLVQDVSSLTSTVQSVQEAVDNKMDSNKGLNKILIGSASLDFSVNANSSYTVSITGDFTSASMFIINIINFNISANHYYADESYYMNFMGLPVLYSFGTRSLSFSNYVVVYINHGSVYRDNSDNNHNSVIGAYGYNGYEVESVDLTSSSFNIYTHFNRETEGGSVQGTFNVYKII